MSANEEINLDGMQLGNKREINRFKITEGSHVYRILPPFGTDHQKKASKQIQVHWGFVKKDGSPSPVACSYPTEGFCPVCDRVRELEAMAEKAKLLNNTEEAESLLKEASSIKVRRTYLLNASNKNGEIGMLEITKTAHDQMIELMREYLNKYGRNPTSLKDGCWFVFSRSGKGFKTEYKVAISKIMVTLEDGDQVEKIDKTPLAQNIVDNYEQLAYDIHAMYKPCKSVDLQRILDGEFIDEVIKWEKKEKKVAVTVDSETTDTTPEVPAKKEAAKKKAPAEATTVPEVAVDGNLDDWMNAFS